jgi:hypothetical protein
MKQLGISPAEGGGSLSLDRDRNCNTLGYFGKISFAF